MRRAFTSAVAVTVADLPAARMNDPFAPPTRLPAAVVEIEALDGGGAVLGHRRRELDLRADDLDPDLLPVTREPCVA